MIVSPFLPYCFHFSACGAFCYHFIVPCLAVALILPSPTVIVCQLVVVLTLTFVYPVEIASNTPESSSSDGCVELPPPYTIKPRTATKTQTKAPPNEPPPPYVDKVESTV